MPKSRKPPNVLFLLPGIAGTEIFAYRNTLFGAHLIWREFGTQSIGHWIDDLSNQLAMRALVPNTNVALVAPPDVGGVILLPAAQGIHRNRDWIEQQIHRVLPFPKGEVRWRMRARFGFVELFWIPTSWVNGMTSELERLGLRLQEVYPRAAIYRALVEQEPGSQLFIQETGAEILGNYHFENGMLRHFNPVAGEIQTNHFSAPDDTTPSDVEQKKVVRKVSAQDVVRGTGMPEALVRLRNAADEAIQINLSARELLAPLTRLSIVSAVIGFVGGGALALQGYSLQESIQKTGSELRRLNPFLMRYQEAVTAIEKDRKYIQAVKNNDDSFVPYAVLTAISAALPSTAWIQKVSFKEKSMQIYGSGSSELEVADALKKNNLIVSVLPSDNSSQYKIQIELGSQSQQADPIAGKP